MTPDPDRLAVCRSRLDGLAEQPLEDQAATLESLHASLRDELDDLLAREQISDDPS